MNLPYSPIHAKYRLIKKALMNFTIICRQKLNKHLDLSYCNLNKGLKMKALVCEQFGPPESLVIKEVKKPIISKGKLLIKVSACGINFPDTLIIEGLYQFKPEMPFSPGAEVCGIVAEIGEQVTGFKIGDRVRMFDGRAVGSIDKLEKNKAVVNYGMFTTNVSVDQLELVEAKK